MNLFEITSQLCCYQVCLFALGCVASFLSAPVYVDWNLVSRTLPHRCLVPSCDDDTSSYVAPFVNFTIPLKIKLDQSVTWDQCQMYQTDYNATDTTGSTTTPCLPQDFQAFAFTGCKEWVYDTSVFTSTTVTEFDLVCDNAWLGPLAGSMYMVGMLMGAIVIGDVSDRYGRKSGLVLSIFLLGGGGLLCSISPNYYMFLIMRFFTGAGGVGLFQVAFILVIEFVGAKWRTFCGLMIEIPFAMGEAMVGVVAYFIRDWRWLQLSLTAPAFLLFSYVWLMPESVLWLVSKNRLEEAMAIINKINTFNKVDTPEKHVLEKQSSLPTTSSMMSTSDSKAGLVDGVTKRRKTVMDLLRYPNMRKRSINLFFCWAVTTLAYYGLSSNAGNLGGNIFVNFIATMLIEIPSYIFAYIVLDRIGRKGTLCMTLIFGGMACVVSGFIPAEFEVSIMVLSLFGKFGIASAFGVIFIYSAELFPTDYRSVGVGACSMCARGGGILAPYISSLSNIYPPLPLLIFGFMAFVSGMLVLLLPETLGSELPQSIEECENFASGQSIVSFACCDRRKTVLDEEASST